jgi:hypothetical protein
MVKAKKIKDYELPPVDVRRAARAPKNKGGLYLLKLRSHHASKGSPLAKGKLVITVTAQKKSGLGKSA